MTETEYEIREFLWNGSSPFGTWFTALDALPAGKVTTALYRLQYGNFSNVESVGDGVFEYKIDFGPGYRIYFGRDVRTLIILLSGGTKKRQWRDIDRARFFWLEYKKMKRTGR
jgi:putative addiction module killer protein